MCSSKYIFNAKLYHFPGSVFLKYMVDYQNKTITIDNVSRLKEVKLCSKKTVQVQLNMSFQLFLEEVVKKTKLRNEFNGDASLHIEGKFGGFLKNEITLNLEENKCYTVEFVFFLPG